MNVPVRRTAVELTPGNLRVLGRPHTPGEVPKALGRPRLERIVGSALKLPADRAAAELADVRRRFADRHRDLDLMLWRNAEQADGLLDGCSDDQRRLVGAYLTQEHAVEAAALTNPSMVAAPDQTGVAAGAVRFVLSLRSIGEGHLSSIAFRSGTVAADGEVTVDPVGRLVETGERHGATHERRHFAAKLAEMGADPRVTSPVLESLPEEFSGADLEEAMAVLDDRPRVETHESARLMRWLVLSNYLLEFDPDHTPLAERLLWPVGPFESRGMEDARFVRFTGDDEAVTYFGTYTAYDGFTILPQLIETTDFERFEISTLSGQAALNKGMALFPRPIDGEYVALSRPDGERLHVVRTDDVRSWRRPSTPLRGPEQPWENVQMGNCGSPIETDEGWLVLTHGVGPMRQYRMGALLLDLDDPGRIVADLSEPILEAADDERDGYVPNVVYSCGALRHGDHLVVPYGASDQRTRVAVYSVEDLLAALRREPSAR